jgi:hypothetical protein
VRQDYVAAADSTTGQGIGSWSEDHLLAWIKERLNLPANLRGLLAKIANVAGISFGSTTFTWTASNTSAANTIPHGLGATPQIILGGPKAPLSHAAALAESSKDGTNIVVQAFATDGVAFTGTQDFYWFAVA